LESARNVAQLGVLSKREYLHSVRLGPSI